MAGGGNLPMGKYSALSLPSLLLTPIQLSSRWLNCFRFLTGPSRVAILKIPFWGKCTALGLWWASGRSLSPQRELLSQKSEQANPHLCTRMSLSWLLVGPHGSGPGTLHQWAVERKPAVLQLLPHFLSACLFCSILWVKRTRSSD